MFKTRLTPPSGGGKKKKADYFGREKRERVGRGDQILWLSAFFGKGKGGGKTSHTV